MLHDSALARRFDGWPIDDTLPLSRKGESVMDNAQDKSVPAPGHLWAVGVISLLWNCIGATDYTMTKLHNASWLKGMSPELMAKVEAFPFYANLAWALGVWGSIVGSILLLARSRHAITAFIVSFLGLVVTNIYQIRHDFPTALPLLATIWIVLIALIGYARRMRDAGVLR